jgi:MoxR-like ATPase
MSAHERIRAAIRAAADGLVARERLVELVVLAAVAQEHLLIIGPPGTAKSEAVRRVGSVLGARRFEYLLGRFTEPSELFGAVDLRRLQAGEVVTDTHGMLPEAELAFLDEVFLGSTAILNTLLGILAERRFRRGHTDLRCPLRVCVGASNRLPDDTDLAAFADRFLLYAFVEPLPDPRLEELLEAGWRGGAVHATPLATVDDLDALSGASRQVDLDPLRPRLAHAIRLLRKEGIALSDRRAVKTQALIAAAAALAGRSVATAADLWPVVLAVPSADGQALARDVLDALLVDAENPALVAAAIDASRGPAARAHGLVEAAAILLGAADPGDEAWRLKVEGLLREIDATYDPRGLPAALHDARGRLVDALAS